MRTLSIITLLSILLCTVVLVAQTPGPRLTGTVLDPSGAVIPGADVRVSQGNTVVREVKTGDSGNFVVEVPPGDYRLEVTIADFNPFRQDVRVTPNMPPLAVRLVLATVNTNVNVAGTANQGVSVDSDTSLTATTLTGETIQALPDDEDQLLAQLQQIAGASGGTQSTASLVVDGFTGGRVPPRDQIQQIIIETNSFSAEGTGGPRIQIITRPGTGPWSGNANFSFQDESLNAKNPLDTNKPSRRQHIFQTSYGGPVIPEKLTLRLNGRSVETEAEANSIRAITPEGPVNRGVFSPTINRNVGLTGQLYFTQSHTLNFTGNYNTNAFKNQGVGGFTLPERATNFKGHNWSAQLMERAIFSPTLINEARASMGHNQNSLLPVSEGFAINVLDAFNGGGAQNRTRRRGTNANFGDTVRWTATPAVNVLIGTDVFYNNQYSNSETNYLGQFTFSSLEDYIAGRPVTFRRTTGNPILEVKQWEFASFVQADWRVNSKLNIGAGARYQGQTNLSDWNNIAPTFQLAYQPRTGTVLRAGGRVSYQPFFIGLVEQLERQNGLTNQVEIVVLNPSYPDPFGNGAVSTPGSNSGSIRTKDPNLIAPYTINSAFTLEQSLPKSWRFSASFDITRAVHLIRTRNVNAPYPGTALPADLLDRLNSRNPSIQAEARDEVDRMRRLYPFIGNVNQFESTGGAFSKNLNLRVFLPANLRVSRVGLAGFMQYTLGRTDDDSSAVNQYDWASEWTRSGNDTRHRMQGNLNLTLPWATSTSFLFFANSGRPYSITTGRDENGDQSTNDRPAGVPRNSATGPSTYNVNMLFSKQISLSRGEQPGAVSNLVPQIPIPPPPPGGGQVLVGPQGPILVGGAPGAPASGPRLSITAQVLNLLNNTQVRGYSGVITSPLFGKATGTAAGRSMTIGFTVNW